MANLLVNPLVKPSVKLHDEPHARGFASVNRARLAASCGNYLGLFTPGEALAALGTEIIAGVRTVIVLLGEGGVVARLVSPFLPDLLRPLHLHR